MSPNNRSNLLWIGIVLSVLLLVSFVETEYYKWFVPLITLTIVFVSRNAAFALATGCIIGAAALAPSNLGWAIHLLVSKYFFGSFDGPWRVSAILFTLTLGAFAGVLEAGGGFRALADRLTGVGQKGRRRIESSALLLGILCFFDGLANGLLVGRVCRPLFDQARIPRARLAFIVDSTSSAVACIAFISTWIAAQLSLISAGISGIETDVSAYQLYFRSIPYNFYCLISLAMVAVVVWRGWNIGPMSRAETFSSESEAKIPAQPSAWRAVVPLLTLIVSIILCFYLWETPQPWAISWEKLSTAFGGSAGPYALTLGSVIGLCAALLCVPQSKRAQATIGARSGATQMLSPLIILVLAWTFGAILTDLGTAQWLAEKLSDDLPISLFPLVIFLMGALVSFSTGSSWGTMGLLMPIAMSSSLLASGENLDMLPPVIAAVFSGAVFGDHCSPLSDTTIVSSFSSGISAHEHIVTQIPYALISAIISAVCGFGAVAAGAHPLVALALALTVVIVLGVILTRASRGNAQESA